VEGLQPENVAVVYKRISAVSSQNRDIGWYLSDAYVVVGSVTLAMLTGIGALALVFRSQRQKAAITSLRRDLETATRQSRELAEGSRA
jgi:hypothetical protein